jgi:pimeloyl-ACP methyl ester carboxylesterase
MTHVTAKTVRTGRLAMHVLTAGSPEGRPALFVHGSLSSSTFWQSTLAAMPAAINAVAPDLRGFGATDPKPLDATRGLRDFADDLHALVSELELARAGPIDLVGWSMGGGAAVQYAIDHPGELRSLVLVAPISPYGFGGTKDLAGTPCWPDHAGSGGGTAAPEYVSRLAARDRTEESDMSPRKLMNTFFFKPPFRAPPDEEEQLLDAVLSTRVGDQHYPGSSTPSENWPGVAPGPDGVNNLMSPRFCDLTPLADVAPKPEILWIRGADDQVISDSSLFDFGQLGQLGAVPGWPGADTYLPQPMIGQTKALLDRFAQNGGRYREEILADCGHSPQIEQPDEFQQLLFAFLGR